MKTSSKSKIESVLGPLRAIYPSVFFGWEEPCYPLKIGIDKDIRREFPELGKKRLQIALRAYTSQISYCDAVLSKKQRIDLSGRPVGDVTERDMHVARVNKIIKQSRTRDPALRFTRRMQMLHGNSGVEA